MNFSIIIPTYNKLPRLKLTLKSLYSQLSEFSNYEVIIIDDGTDISFSNEFELLRRKYDFLYYKTKNLGRSYARNIGLFNATKKTIFFLDDDIILSPKFIETHINIQNSNPCILHGEIKNFIYSYPFVDPLNCEKIFFDNVMNDNTIRLCSEKCKLLKSLDYTEIYNVSKETKIEKAIKNVFLKNSLHKWISFNGANISCPKQWLLDENGFDEKFGITWGCEDLELGYRLNLSQHPFRYSIEASCCHLTHIRKDYKKEHNTSLSYFYNKYKDERILEVSNLLFN